jgi:hypothetical protein
MSNTAKSWKGAPSTNLLPYSNNFESWSLANTTVKVNSYLAPDGTLTADAVSNTPSLGSYIYPSAFAGYVVSTQYTRSVYAKAGVGTGLLVYEWRTSGGTYYFDLLAGTCSGTGASIVAVGNGWYRCIVTATFTGTGSGDAWYVGAYGSTPTPTTIYFWNAQLEVNAFATPYIPTTTTTATRTNTQNFADITGNNAITAASLTYNTDGTHSYNGASTYVTMPENAVFNTQTPSVEVWIKPTALTQNGFFFEKGNVNTQYALFLEGANITWRQYVSGTLTSLLATSATYLNTSQYAQIVGTFTSGSRCLYVNGVLVASDATTGTFTNNPNGCSIGSFGGENGTVGGRAYFFNGSIGSVKVYNRVLTANEVKQNFNALRGRYGI